MENKCKNCRFYYAATGSEGRWMNCNNPKMLVANAYENYENVPSDGIGYSDPSYEEELAELYVGPEFGCIHFKIKSRIV